MQVKSGSDRTEQLSVDPLEKVFYWGPDQTRIKEPIKEVVNISVMSVDASRLQNFWELSGFGHAATAVLRRERGGGRGVPLQSEAALVDSLALLST